MGDYDKHLSIAKEKLASLNEAYHAGRHSVVGDLGIKVAEQLVSAHAASNDEHPTNHKERLYYANRHLPESIQEAMKRMMLAYGNLGYDGRNGDSAKSVKQAVDKIADFFEEEFDEKVQ